MTLRNWINLALAALSGLALAALSISPCGLDHDGRIAAQGVAGGLLAGMITPGSPIGRALDALLPPPPAPPSALAVRASTLPPERVQ